MRMLRAKGIESRYTKGKMTLVVVADVVGEDEVDGKLL